jgi:Protein of unknown function (DUF3592)
MIISYIVGFGFCAVGALFFFGTLAASIAKARARRHWPRVNGVVLSNAERLSRQEQTLLAPVVAFTNREGRTITFTSGAATSWQRYAPGRRVPVIYNPALDDDAEIATFASRWFGPLTLMVLGLFFLLLGLHIFRTG